MHAQNYHYTMLIYCINGRRDFIRWQILCPIPFVNLTNKIVIN